jgi:hypothetical protein
MNSTTDAHGLTRMKTNLQTAVLMTCACLAAASARAGQPFYQNNFEATETGKLPADFLVLNGNFAVKSLGTNRVLELPGAPLDGFAVQFGPAEAVGMSVNARIHGTAQGKRSPAFGVGLGGAGGWRLQVSPGRKAVELFKDQELKASAACNWKSGAWMRFRLQLRQVKEGAWRIEGRVWLDGADEPEDWILTADETEQPVAGRASVAGAPFSGTPIWFDDLAVEKAGGK